MASAVGANERRAVSGLCQKLLPTSQRAEAARRQSREDPSGALLGRACLGAEEAVGDLQSNGGGEPRGRFYLGGRPEARSKYEKGVREAGNAQHGLERTVGNRATANPAKKELYEEKPSVLPDRDSPSFLRDK